MKLKKLKIRYSIEVEVGVDIESPERPYWITPAAREEVTNKVPGATITIHTEESIDNAEPPKNFDVEGEIVAYNCLPEAGFDGEVNEDGTITVYCE